MRISLAASIVFAGTLLLAQSGAAQENTPVRPADDLHAFINGPTDIQVGRTIVLDASLSRITGEQVEYTWTINDSPQAISRAVEALYTPEQPGELTFHLVIRSIIDGQERSIEAPPHTVAAYARKIVLVADPRVSGEQLQQHVRAAEAAGVYLEVLQPPESSLPFGAEESLAAYLLEQSDSFLGATFIVLWTDAATGLQALMRVAEQAKDVAQGLAKQTIVAITDHRFQTVARISHGPYIVLQPQQIIVTRPSAISALVSQPDAESFIRNLAQEGIDQLRIDQSAFAFRPWNLLSELVNYMLERGISSQIVILLLVLPVIATILAFFKQVIGITAFGLYTPSIVALSFLALGIPTGVIFLLLIILIGYVTRTVIRRLRLLYIPKVALVLTAVSLSLLVLLAAGAYAGLTITRDTVFILLIMSTLSESFLNLKREEGLFSAVIGIGETLLASLICVLLVQWRAFQALLLAYPELLLLTILLNLLLGRWTGLRLLEYWRFRDVFRHLHEEE